MQMPFSEYRNRREHFQFMHQSAALRGAVILVGPGAVDATLATLHKQTDADWVAASSPAVVGTYRLGSEETQAFLGDAGRTATLSSSLSPERCSLRPHCDGRRCLCPVRTAQAVYSDLDIESTTGPYAPSHFRPSTMNGCWSRDIARIYLRCALSR